MNTPASRLPSLPLRFFPLSALAILTMTGCGDSPAPEPEVTVDLLAGLTYGAAAEQFDELARVRVVLSTAKLDENWVVVRGVFSPEDAEYHLYSKDMPKEGIKGIGRPTLLAVTEGVAQSGSTLADSEPHDMVQFDLTLPVYPEGPVTLYHLVRPEAGAASLTAALTYMSCSSELCNAPVENAAVGVPLP